MTDQVRDAIDRAFSLPGVIARELDGFGGILRCHRCHAEMALGNIADYLANGWPECSGHGTMTWVTARQLAEELADAEKDLAAQSTFNDNMAEVIVALIERRIRQLKEHLNV